ncbi:MAG: PIG-L family deacetylase [Opitutaceae bacterium]|nr:PIG-L family deacetylase [Opitutaceae bacterium]
MVPALRRRGLLALGASLVLGAGCLRALPPSAPATPALPSAEGIAQELRSFANTGTVLHVAAHPDDENTELIIWLSRGRGYRTGYLSLTRGDGGQNQLGPDFDARLGVLRTQELLAARRLDGGRQFFTRAIDFGYSKSPEETLRFWDHQQVLADVVRIYRQFRPDVVVTRFPVPPGSGGHGQHTASAILAVEAFKLAGDPHAFPEQIAAGLTPWQPRRVLWNAWPGRDGGLDGQRFTTDIAGTDPVTGEAFGLIAAHSRAMHRTQGLAGFVNRARTGANEQIFIFLAGEPASADLMEGVDTTWGRFPAGAEIDRLAAALLAGFKPDDPAASVPAILELRTRLATLPADPLVDDKRAQLDRILQSCLGLEIAIGTDQPEAVPGESLRIRYALGHRAKGATVQFTALHSPGLSGAKFTTASSAILSPGQTLAGELTGTLLPQTPITQPYWLRTDGTTGSYDVADPRLIGRPENPPAMPLEFALTVNGQLLLLSEALRPFAVIPPVSLAFNSDSFVLVPGAEKPVEVEVAAARAQTRGRLRLAVPPGWHVSPAAQDFNLAGSGDRARLTFTVTAPATASAGHVTASAEVEGRSFSHTRVELGYSHLPRQLLQPPAQAHAAAFAVEVKARQIGYLPGAGDAVAGCLAQLGCTVRPLTGADLTPEKLAGLDAVVIGVRAFNERADLKDNFPGLLAWVEAGGTVIAQYNRPNGLLAPDLGPYPLSIQGPAPALRVTDESAPVTFLAPDHPALNTPNRIGPADFDGWLQERGAYFPSSWDQGHYTALLGMNDPGEAQLQGSLLIARHGRGHYVYTGLAFFRQLPAGVPGAYRLLANLVSLGK